MKIDPAMFAQQCVRQGVIFGVNPHYMLGVAQLRSGISDDSTDSQIGPFRLKQTEWDTNSNNDEFDVHFTPAQISSPIRQCAVFALMAHRAFDAFVSKEGRNPSAKELYLQQWPDAATATFPTDFQAALDNTAALLGPAADAVLDDPASVPPTLKTPDQSTTRPVPPWLVNEPDSLASLTHDQFIEFVAQDAGEAMKATGVPASVTVAQAILESAWGKHTIRDAKNLFGIKGTGPAGSVSVQTREVFNGRSGMEQANFRKYNSFEESILDHANLFLTNRRYAPALAVKNDPDSFAREIQKAGYATDPEYAAKLIGVMQRFNLYRFDSGV
jgi:flagellum-specific peptidoglycan hydrolase FlgJ